jgi:hypothetical protein
VRGGRILGWRGPVGVVFTGPLSLLAFVDARVSGAECVLGLTEAYGDTPVGAGSLDDGAEWGTSERPCLTFVNGSPGESRPASRQGGSMHTKWG